MNREIYRENDPVAEAAYAQESWDKTENPEKFPSAAPLFAQIGTGKFCGRNRESVGSEHGKSVSIRF